MEWVHQTIGNIIYTFRIHDIDLDNENPWQGILSSTDFAIRSTVHTTIQHTPYLVVKRFLISTGSQLGIS